ncbi:MAG: CDP-alcohol phosphatidyltransferase family protein [Deltaproteobacteria bacterium]|nr:CDP-alcohol phosphatidyltransferase family protein [Deltaproteobacteria bacterium]
MLSESIQVSHPPEATQNTPPSLAILNACHPGAWEKVGGITLTARTLFHLKEAGIKKVVLLLSTDSIPIELTKWQGTLELQQVRAKVNIPGTILSITDLEQRFLYIDTAHLIDPRLLYTLASASGTTFAYIDPVDRERRVIRAGFLKIEDLHIWAKQGSAALISHSGFLFPGDINPFCPEIRGPLTPYFMEVRSKDDAREATRLLIRSQQKKVMDLPAQFIDPPIENALTLLLCNTPVTPNMITLIGAAVGVVVAWLFWHGYFVAGALCTFLVEILDGVDGKLARTKLHYTKFGKYEDVIDYIYENSWYVALAVGLRDTAPNNLPAFLAGLLILSDTADNIVYTLAGRWYSKSIDLFSPFDATFRRIAGRRNVYGIMFIFGFSLGYPFYTFAVVAVWAALTAVIHGVRLIQYNRTMKKTLGQQAVGT